MQTHWAKMSMICTQGKCRSASQKGKEAPGWEIGGQRSDLKKALRTCQQVLGVAGEELAPK